MTSSHPLREVVRRRPLVSFFVLAYGLSWLAILPVVLSPAGLGVIHAPVPIELMMLVATGPTLAALATQWLSEGDFRIVRFGGSVGRALLGMAGGAVLVVLAFAVIPALVLTRGAAAALHWPAILAVSLGWWANPFNLLGGPLNEEPGWRGFALPRLQAHLGPWKASLLLGLLWAGWHLPMVLIQGWLGVPIWAFVTLIVALSVLMTWAFNLSRFGILTTIVMHAVFNASYPMLVGLCQGVPTMQPGLPIDVAAVAVVAVLAILVTRGKLGQADPAPLPS